MWKSIWHKKKIKIPNPQSGKHPLHFRNVSAHANCYVIYTKLISILIDVFSWRKSSKYGLSKWSQLISIRRYSRFEIGIKQDVIAVHLEAVLVVDDDLLHTLQGLDDDVVDPLERFLDLQWRHPFYHIMNPSSTQRKIVLSQNIYTTPFPRQEKWSVQSFINGCLVS